MLKIRQNTLLLHSKDKWLTPHLLAALCFALTFHLLFYLIFNVTPITLDEPKQILPPIAVFSEAPQAIVNIQSEQSSIPIPSYLLSTKKEPTPSTKIKVPFPTTPSQHSFSLPIPPHQLSHIKPPSKVVLSLLTPWQEALQLNGNLALDLPREENTWTLELGFDGSSGKIIWMKPLSDSIPEGLWSLADSIKITADQEGIFQGILVVEVR